jgi:hypothetical protein
MTTIQMRRDTDANWASTNPALAQGEWGLNTTNNLLKIGDGSTTWNSLPYFMPTFSGWNKWLSSNYYQPGWISRVAAGTTAPNGTNTIVASPVIIPNRITITSIKMGIGTGSSNSVIRLGIYDSDPISNQPRNLIADLGTQPTLTATTTLTFSTSQTLNAGVYWIGYANQSTTTSAGSNVSIYYAVNSAPFVSLASVPAAETLGAVGAYNAYLMNYVSGAFPSKFTITGNGISPRYVIGT